MCLDIKAWSFHFLGLRTFSYVLSMNALWSPFFVMRPVMPRYEAGGANTMHNPPPSLRQRQEAIKTREETNTNKSKIPTTYLWWISQVEFLGIPSKMVGLWKYLNFRGVSSLIHPSPDLTQSSPPAGNPSERSCFRRIPASFSSSVFSGPFPPHRLTFGLGRIKYVVRRVIRENKLPTVLHD